MKKKLIIYNIAIPTAIGYATFFSAFFYLFQRLFFNYRWFAIIPFIIVTGFFYKRQYERVEDDKATRVEN